MVRSRNRNRNKVEKPRNYEFRTVPGVDSDVRVSRDGDIQINGRNTYNLPMITKLDGTRITIQMAIHLAFPDIPMRVTPTR